MDNADNHFENEGPRPLALDRLLSSADNFRLDKILFKVRKYAL